MRHGWFQYRPIIALVGIVAILLVAVVPPSAHRALGQQGRTPTTTNTPRPTATNTLQPTATHAPSPTNTPPTVATQGPTTTATTGTTVTPTSVEVPTPTETSTSTPTPTAVPPPPPMVSIKQLDVQLDAGRKKVCKVVSKRVSGKMKRVKVCRTVKSKPTVIANSNWLRADVTFTGSAAVRYLNLVVNGVWGIQNIPSAGVAGQGIIQTTSYAFGIGKLAGRPLQMVTYGLALNDRPTDHAPPEDKQTTVHHALETSCPQGAQRIPLAAAGPLLGVPVQGEEESLAFYTDFPNQNSGVNECGPVAVSNSLQWLALTGALKTKDGQSVGPSNPLVSIAALKAALGWTETGVGPDWINKKEAYAKNFAGLETTRIPNTEPEKLRGYMTETEDRYPCDMELDMGPQPGQTQGHIAAITGVGKIPKKNPKDSKEHQTWTILIHHDSTQGQKSKSNPNGDHNPVTDTVTYDQNSRTITDGGVTLKDRKVKTFVVECLKKTKKK